MSLKFCRRIALLAAESVIEGQNLEIFLDSIKKKDPHVSEGLSNYEELHRYLTRYENEVWQKSEYSNISTPDNILLSFNDLLEMDLKNEGFWPIAISRSRCSPRCQSRRSGPGRPASRSAHQQPSSRSRTEMRQSRRSRWPGCWRPNRAAIRKLKNKKYSKNKNLKSRKTKGIKKKNPRRR